MRRRLVVLSVGLAGISLAASGWSAPTEKPTATPRGAFTDDDLRRYHPAPTPSPSAESTARATPTTPPPNPIVMGSERGSGDDTPLTDQQKWQTRAAVLYGQLAAARKHVEETQTALDAAKSPFKPGKLVWYAQDPKVPELEKELAAAQDTVAALEKQVEDMQADARRDGIPPGWIAEP